LPESETRSGLRILFDQNVPLEIAAWLRKWKPDWQVQHVLEVGLEGRLDPDVFSWAQANECVFVTFDSDFGDIRNFARDPHHGIIRLRVRPTTMEQTQSALVRLMDQIEESELPGALVIIGPRTVRVRRGPLPRRS
jgi:predicted nuclease of predicted toxin-antitoxin system